MTIEPPLPTNIILDKLRAVLPALQSAAKQAPHDARITTAVAHLSATIAALELPSAEAHTKTSPP